MSHPILLVVAAALVDPDNRVLITKRPEGKELSGLWEFPGGKVMDGELPEGALRRELMEELAIDVCADCLSPFTFASHTYGKFHLLMPLYLIRTWDGVVTPTEGQEIIWTHSRDLSKYNMPPADTPLIPMLRDHLG